MGRESETESLERAAEAGPLTDIREAVRALKWIRDFCEAHHTGEPSGVHLHRLLVDIPHYLDYVIATLDEAQDGGEPEAVVPSKPRLCIFWSRGWGRLR